MQVNKLHLALFVSWLIFTIAAFAKLTFDRLVQFDPDGVLNNISRAEFANTILNSSTDINNNRTIINFYQPNCACNNISDIHVQQLEEVALKTGYKFINIEVNEELLVPSTPSIAIIGEASELIYFGPYGEGLGCTQTNGFAATVFENHLKGFSANLIVKTASGCYCNT